MSKDDHNHKHESADVAHLSDLGKRFEGKLPTCKEIIDLLNLYVDGELEERARAAFDKHFALCPPCVDFLANYTKAIELGAAAARKESASELPCSVQEHLRAFLIKHGVPLKKSGE